jgi:peptidoglycan/xylan/chitin deacetylase (PgdA/CDA1 family)
MSLWNPGYGFAKRAAKWSLFRLGVLGLALSLISLFSTKKRGVILTYHFVRRGRDLEGAFPGLETGIGADVFSQQVVYFKRHFEICSISTLVAKLRESEANNRILLAISFDDAYRSIYDNALPVLQSHSATATVFVPYSYVGTEQAFWWLTISHLFRRIRTAEYTELKGDLLQRFKIGTQAPELFPSNVDTDENRRAARLQLALSIAEATESRREQIMAVVNKYVKGVVESDKLVVTSEQLSAIATSGFEIASHTMLHKDLTSISPADLEEELASSKSQLAAGCRTDVHGIAYPYGRFDDAVVAATRAAGYEWAVITRHGVVDQNTDKFRLPRLPGDHDLPSVLTTIIRALLSRKQ